ncbi:zinc finger protein 99-like [Mytilus californianus]|uniref:zinc finger protein 99-like n=1 Tax=Mytilus californianus TaxID=6549 RepID=UPI002245A8D5|nr:zinc finger protein 99-like [Mytilus californianus]
MEDSKLYLFEGKREIEMCYIEKEVEMEDSKLGSFEVNRETDSSETECNMLMLSDFNNQNNTNHSAHVNMKIENDDLVDFVHVTANESFYMKETEFNTDLPVNAVKDNQTMINRSENNGEAFNWDKISKLSSSNDTEEKNKQTRMKCYKYKFGKKEFSFKSPIISVDKSLTMLYGGIHLNNTSPENQESKEKQGVENNAHVNINESFNIKDRELNMDLLVNSEIENKSENNGKTFNYDNISKLISSNDTEEVNKQTKMKCYKYKFGEKEFSFKSPVVSVDKNLPMLYMLYGGKHSNTTSPEDQAFKERQGMENNAYMDSYKSELENIKKLNKSEAEKPVSVVSSSHDHPVCCQESLSEENENTNMISYKCKFCKKDSFSKSSLRSHIKLHKESEGFVSYLPKQPCVDLIKSDENKDQIIGKVYNCFLCKKEFTIESSMIRHIELHKEKRQHKCKICGKGFKRKHQLQKHEVIHTDCKPFKCDSCQTSFKNARELRQHIRNPQKEIFDCSECGESFNTYDALRRHENVHSRLSSFSCHICGKKVSHSNKERHLKLHDSKKHYRCAKCGIKFTFKCHYSRHLLNHSETKPYKCHFDICDKTFKSKPELKKHLRLQHQKFMNFSFCHPCGKAFKYRSQLLIHENMHRQDKGFTCDICGKKFSYKNSMIKHQQIHFEEKPFECAPRNVKKI